jgi:hypothetical protein
MSSHTKPNARIGRNQASVRETLAARRTRVAWCGLEFDGTLLLSAWTRQDVCMPRPPVVPAFPREAARQVLDGRRVTFAQRHSMTTPSARYAAHEIACGSAVARATL